MSRAGRTVSDGLGHADSLADSLERCAERGRGALTEALAAASAAIDAASFVLFGRAADESALEPFWMLVSELRGLLLRGGSGSHSMLQSLSVALDEEVARWERLGPDDPAAQTVSRLFRELRSVLREFGMPSTQSRPGAHRRKTAGRGGSARQAL